MHVYLHLMWNHPNQFDRTDIVAFFQTVAPYFAFSGVVASTEIFKKRVLKQKWSNVSKTEQSTLTLQNKYHFSRYLQ